MGLRRYVVNVVDWVLSASLVLIIAKNLPRRQIKDESYKVNDLL